MADKDDNKILKSLETPEEYMKREIKKSKKTQSNKVSKSKAERLRKKKERAFEDMSDGFMKLKQEFLDTALFSGANRKKLSSSSKYGNVKVIRNLDLQKYVLESLRANMSATQTIFLLAQDFGYTPESAKQYYWQTVKYLRTTIDEESKEELKYILTKQMQSIQRLALTQGDLKSSIKAGEIVAKLGGLFEPDKVELNGNIDFTLSFPSIDNTNNEEVTENEDDVEPELNVN